MRHILSRPKISVIRAETAAWELLYNNDVPEGVWIHVVVVLGSKGMGTDVTGYLLIPNTCFNAKNPAVLSPVIRIPENTREQVCSFQVFVPVLFLVKEPSASFAVTLRLVPEGHQKFGIVGKRCLDTPYIVTALSSRENHLGRWDQQQVKQV